MLGELAGRFTLAVGSQRESPLQYEKVPYKFSALLTVNFLEICNSRSATLRDGWRRARYKELAHTIRHDVNAILKILFNMPNP